MAGEWVTIEELKTYLGFKSPSEPSPDDQTLADCESAARNWICRARLGRTQIVQPANDIVEVHDGDGSQVIWTKEYPIASITSIVVDDEIIPEIDDDNEYGWHIPTGAERFGRIELSGYVFTEGIHNVVITYKPGYATLPDDLKIACARIAIALFKQFPYLGVHQSAGELNIQIAEISDKLGTDLLLKPFVRLRG